LTHSDAPEDPPKHINGQVDALPGHYDSESSGDDQNTYIVR